MSDGQILTLAEAAELLRVHPNTLYAQASVGRVPCRKVGRQYRFIRSALERWLEGQDEDADEPFPLSAVRP